MQAEDGTLVSREKGSPQGSVINPLLANLFLHYAFDEWMRRNYDSITFESYADDILVHCKSEKQAGWIKKNPEELKRKGRHEMESVHTQITF